MDSLPTLSTVTQGLGWLLIAFFVNMLLEHLFKKRLLTSVWTSLKKWWFKKTKTIDVNFVFRIDFNQKLSINPFKNIVKEFIDNVEKNHQWTIDEISFEVKKDYTHRVSIRLIEDTTEIDKADGAFVSIKTNFKLGDLRDCLSSISSFSEKLMKHLTLKYNLPFFVQNGEFSIQNPNAEFDIPYWLKNEAFKLSIIAQTADDLNLQLYLDHAKIETKGITFEPKVSKYLEEIFINYYVGKESGKGKTTTS